MPSIWQWAGFVAGGIGCAGCALVTKFDPAVTDSGAETGGDDGTTGCPPSAILCEDFENGMSMTKWTDKQENFGSATIDGVHVHSGSNALHLHCDAAAVDGDETTADWRRLGTLPNTLYLRAWVYWQSPLAASVANILQLQDQARNAGFVLYNGQSVFGWSAWPSPGDARTTQTMPPTASWTCIVWTLANTDVAVNINGTSDPTLEDPSAPTFPFWELDVGLTLAHDMPEPALDAWMDDVVVDKNPLRCP